MQYWAYYSDNILEVETLLLACFKEKQSPKEVKSWKYATTLPICIYLTIC